MITCFFSTHNAEFNVRTLEVSLEYIMAQSINSKKSQNKRFTRSKLLNYDWFLFRDWECTSTSTYLHYTARCTWQLTDSQVILAARLKKSTSLTKFNNKICLLFWQDYTYVALVFTLSLMTTFNLKIAQHHTIQNHQMIRFLIALIRKEL